MAVVIVGGVFFLYGNFNFNHKGCHIWKNLRGKDEKEGEEMKEGKKEGKEVTMEG